MIRFEDENEPEAEGAMDVEDTSGDAKPEVSCDLQAYQYVDPGEAQEDNKPSGRWEGEVENFRGWGKWKLENTMACGLLSTCIKDAEDSEGKGRGDASARQTICCSPQHDNRGN